MSKPRCPFCIAKDDEITRLHRLVEKLSMRTQYLSAPLPPNTQLGFATLSSQAEVPEDEPPIPGAIPMTSFIDQFNEVHGDGAWASLAGIGREKAE
jgi:hypothetical protein